MTLITLNTLIQTNHISSPVSIERVGECDTLSCTYDSIESFRDHLMYAAIKEGSVLTAVELAKEINQINGYKVVSDYDMYLIKSNYKECRKGKYEGGGKEKGISKEESASEKYRQLQKAYMKLLSV